MNRLQIRNQMKNLLSRNVPDTDLDFNSKCNSSIDLALKRLSNEVPLALLPEYDTVSLLAEYETNVGAITATASRSTDPYVVRIGTSPSLSTGFPVLTDGTWDGIYWLEFILSDGTHITRQSREWWVDSVDVGAGIHAVYVSLVQPITQSFTSVHVRIFQPYFYLSQDTMEICEGTITNTASRTLYTLPEGFARDVGMMDAGSTTAKGMPQAIARSIHYQLDAPNFIPTVVTAGIVGDFGPEGIGAFTYCFTYAWGKRDINENITEANSLRPQWESGPSPVSVTVSPTIKQSVVVGLPDIDWELNYHTAGSIRSTHSGVSKRIYRSRSTVGAGTVTALETPVVYQFLGEVSGEVTSFTDDGSLIPEYFTRLPEVTGYYAYRPYPQHNAHYDLKLRTYKRPRSLDNDSDVAKISAECVDALLFLAVSYLAFYDNDPGQATYFEQEAQKQIKQFRSRHATPAKIHPASAWTVDSGDVWSAENPFFTYSTYRSV